MIKVSLFDNTLDIPCEGEDCRQLQNAIELIEEKLTQIPTSMRNESRLLLLAINLGYDLQKLKRESLELNESFEQKVSRLLEIIENKDNS